MAETEGRQQTETVQDREIHSLKYLEFVQLAAVHAIVFFWSIYNFAKENSGPLRPGVQTVEGTVKTVVGPVYEKFHGVPFKILKFADRKVDELVHEVDRHVPAVVKGASCQAFSAARSVSSEVQRAGVIDTAAELAKVAYTRVQPTVKELYIRYEPVAEGYAVSAWRSLNRLPLFPEVAHIVVPTAAYWSEKYNRSVLHIADKGYMVSAYMPLVPTERIAKVFGGEEDGSKLDSGRVEPPPSAGADVAVAAE
eukprot:TRINITY_DN4679_c0_g1_i1.p1 TRINITY_DN4679_c0_g1~~TRINITY_DN4679_c0_g1_i1.p1  ORF type:complete len:252 (-),score=13.10 TRINITY_DN4679_c0_g1_i1:705-1460(-)